MQLACHKQGRQYRKNRDQYIPGSQSEQLRSASSMFVIISDPWLAGSNL
jgi:hypothetical protein